MLDLALIFINGFLYFAIGIIVGFLLLYPFNYAFKFAFSASEAITVNYGKVLLQAILIGFIISLLQFFARSSIVSYVDLINIIVFLLSIIFGVILVIIIVRIISQDQLSFGSLLRGRSSSLPGVLFFVVFFGIILFAIFDFILNIFVFLVFLALIVVSIVVLGKLLLDEFKGQRTIMKSFRNVNAVIGLLIIFIMLFSASSYLVVYQSNFVAPVDQAKYFNGLINVSTDDLFHNEIPDNQIRLINPDLADALIRKHASVFGSNVVPLSIHITTKNGKLVWVGAMAPDNFFNQKILGLLVLDASDPNAIPEKINLTDATVSEGLFYDANTAMKGWDTDPMQTYGRSYITWVPNGFSDPSMNSGDIVQVQTFYSPVPFGYQTRFGGVKIFDMRGDLLKTYTDRLGIPSWISQSMDENWLEENIGNWGSLKSGSGFDIFAGGFLGLTQPSQDRLDISQDTRYIISPDTNETVAVTPVHPASNHLTNAGVFVSTANSITYYDYHQRNYISTDAVIDLVQSKEPPVSQGENYATLPMLYPINVNNGTRLVWFVPVYHKITSIDSNGDTVVTNVQFQGLYVYDAVESNVFGRTYLSDFSSASAMVKQAKENYRASLLGVTPTNTTQEDFENATVLQKSSFVQDGTTYIVFKTNNTSYEYLYASPKILPSKDWLTALMDVDVGSNIRFQAYKSNDVWYLSSLEKL